MSGYIVKIRGFIPCGKDAAGHNLAFQSIEAVREALADIGVQILDFTDEYKPNRKIPASEASPERMPVLPSSQEGTAPEEKSLPVASSGAVATWPGRPMVEQCETTDRPDAAGGVRNPEDAVYSDRRVPRNA